MMRIPVWARDDSSARLKFLMLTLASYHNPNCTLRNLADDAGLHANTVSRAQKMGRMSKRIAVALTETAPDAGIKPVWLIAPDLIQLNEQGDIVE